MGIPEEELTSLQEQAAAGAISLQDLLGQAAGLTSLQDLSVQEEDLIKVEGLPVKDLPEQEEVVTNKLYKARGRAS